MNELKSFETKLNAMIVQRDVVKAVEMYYDEDCTFHGSRHVATTGTGQGRHLQVVEFLKRIEKVINLTLVLQLIGEDTTMSEWTFELQTSHGNEFWNEVLSRKWKNGKIVSERYYTAA